MSRSCAEALIAEDPELQKSIRGLEAMLRVRASLGSGREKGVLAVVSPSPCRQAPGSCLANDSEFPLKNGIRAAPGLCSETDSEFSLKNGGRDRTAHATAGESDEIIGSSRLSELEFPTLICLPLLPHLLFLLRLLLLVHMRAPHPCVLHTIRGRTRLGFRVPRERSVPKVGFPVRPKICSLSQRWRQG